MTATVLEIVTDAFSLIGVIDETGVPSAEQGANALRLLNDFLANEAVDGLRLGWYPQSDLSNTAPLRDADIYGVKRLLAKRLAPAYGIKITDPVLLDDITNSERQLAKRSILYVTSDLSELSRPQASPWGGQSWP